MNIGSEKIKTTSVSTRRNKKRKVVIKEDRIKVDVTNDTNAATVDLATAYTPMSPTLDYIINTDFSYLASHYPDFAVQWNMLKQRQREKQKDPKSNNSFSTHVDFEFNSALTKAILNEYFNLSLPSMPAGNLCPPVPNRLNYVLWIKELLVEMYDCNDDYFAKDRNCDQISLSFWKRSYRGIDIGTGASCIYPLLLCSKYFDREGHPWQFLGTDIDPLSIQHAQQNIEANQLQNKIKVALVPPTHEQCEVLKSTKLLCDGSVDSIENQTCTPIEAAMKVAKQLYHDEESRSNSTSYNKTLRFDFVMTNPPFYSTIIDATKPRIGDSRERTDMTLFESVYPGESIGGEVKFVLDMIHDSLNYKNNISWFTSMLGKKNSYVPIIKELESIGLGKGSIRKTEFIQGKTIRWGIAWTFRQPSLRSKANLVQTVIPNFDIKLQHKLTHEEALEEISKRIEVFCSTFYSDSELSCERKSNNHLCIMDVNNKNKVETQSAVTMSLIMDLFIKTHLENDFKTTNDKNKATDSVNVQFVCYCPHLKDTKRKINTLQTQIIGEIGRTNRRWRRQAKKKMNDYNMTVN